MHDKEFKRIVWQFFREKGFKKSGAYFVKESCRGYLQRRAAAILLLQRLLYKRGIHHR